jgi:2,4-dienoyl-CoA reductase-like NADH-dependent reductase (Old Yellow Enzyme family)
MDFFTEMYTSVITDSHTAGGTPVSIRDAAQASTLLNSGTFNLCVVKRSFIFLPTIPAFFQKKMPEFFFRLQKLQKIGR